MNRFEILDQADQQFGTIINGRRVTMRIRKNPTTDRCTLDLSIDDQPVLHGRKIVTGIDLLAPFNLGLGVVFAAAVVSEAVPTLDALVGGSVRVFSATDAEVAAAPPPPFVPKPPVQALLTFLADDDLDYIMTFDADDSTEFIALGEFA